MLEPALNFHHLVSYSKLALALSGGSDSLALMHLIAEWQAELDDGERPEITVLTVDHRLRAASADEARWAQRQAEDLGFSHEILTWQGEKPQRNIQEKAREIRYRLMTAYCRRHNITALLTAHHLSDQAETMFMHLSRGSGVDGLSAIPRKGRFEGVEILRPLLKVPKSELTLFLRAKDLDWKEDPSNQEDRFERVRVRRLLAEGHLLGLTASSLALSAERLSRAREALEHQTDLFLKSAARLHSAGYCDLDLRAIDQESEEIFLRGLSRVLQAIGGRLRAPRLAKLERLVEALKGGKRSRETLAGCRLERGDRWLTVFRELRRGGGAELSLTSGEQALWDHRFHVGVAAYFQGSVTIKALTLAGFKSISAKLEDKKIVPHGARASLVSFWQNDEILSVPHLGFFVASPKSDPGAEMQTFFTTEFANRPLLLGGSSFARK